MLDAGFQELPRLSIHFSNVFLWLIGDHSLSSSTIKMHRMIVLQPSNKKVTISISPSKVKYATKSTI